MLYRHMGVAVAFSPRLEALIAEVAHLAPTLAEKLSLIHAGTHSPNKEDRLRRAIETAGLNGNSDIQWVSGAPDAAILSAVHTSGMDLLLAGALEKERPLRYYLGSVAHNLVRDAPCSLMLLTEPQIEPKPIKRIVVVAEYTDGALTALRKAIRLAEMEGSERVFVIRVLSQYGAAMLMTQGVRRERALAYETAGKAEEEGLLQDFVDAAGQTGVPIDARCIEGDTGYIAARFSRKERADLLVMPSTHHQGHFFERLFPSDMEWVLREIPCNLWVVRDTVH
jgi:nucleotide-binding universal stress UspA family protein